MREIKIDFDNPGFPQRLDVVENDAQSRFFKAVLYKDGKAYTAPSGATYSIMYRGFGPQNEGWYDTINDGAGKRAACSVSGNVVTCEIARQALRVPGHVSVMLCVTGSNGYMLHGWPIDCNCRNDSYTSGTSVESFFYITQVTNADWNSAIQAWEELKNMIDPTLTLSGKAADAKETGKIKKSVEDLKTGINDSVSAAVKHEIDEKLSGQTEEIIKEWLEKHPEYTTYVADGAISERKLSEEFYKEVSVERSETFKVETGKNIYNTQKLIIIDIAEGEAYRVKINDPNNVLSKFHLYECDENGASDIGEYIANKTYELIARKDITYLSISTSVTPAASGSAEILVWYKIKKVSILESIKNMEDVFNNVLVESVHDYSDYGILINKALSKSNHIVLNGAKTYVIKTPIIIKKGQRLNGNGATIINKTGTYCIELISVVGEACTLENVVIENGKGVTIKGPNITVQDCVFKNVEECIYVPVGYNSYEFFCSNCHMHGDTLIETGIVVDASDAYFDGITMLNYKYPMLIGGGNTKVNNLHPWINVGIENRNSRCILMRPPEGKTASLYISNSCFDGYETVFEFQKDYSSIFCVNSNTVYSAYTWNDETRTPQLVKNTTDKFCRLRIVCGNFVNTTGSKTIGMDFNKMILYTASTRINNDDTYSQEYNVYSSVAIFDTEGSEFHRNGDNTFRLSIKARATGDRTGAVKSFKVCNLNLKCETTQLNAILKSGSGNLIPLHAYVDGYEVYCFGNEGLEIHENDLIRITGDVFLSV